MANYTTTDTELTSVADAIRLKGGTQSPLVYPTGFVSAINAIPTVGIYQSKVVSPIESQQVVSPDSGYDALSSVTVNAIDSNYIGSNIPQRTSANLSASGSVVTVPSGYYATDVSKAINAGAIIAVETVQEMPIGTITLGSGTGIVYVSRTKAYIPIQGEVTISGYLAAGTKGNGRFILNGADSSYQLPTASASTYTPSSTTQTIPSGVYLTGVQTIEPIPISVDNHRLIVPEGYIGV